MSLDSLINKLAASYIKPEPPPPPTKEQIQQMLAEQNERRAKRQMRKLVDRSPSTLAPSLPSVRRAIVTDPPGTLDATGFTIADRKAGVRLSEPDEHGKRVLYCDQREIRNDKIRAMGAYKGFEPLPARRYDEKGKTPIQTERSFGEQDLEARMAAHRELHPVRLVDAPPRRIPLSVKGYVAGMPNALRRKVWDLRGRLQLAADTEAEHLKLAKEATTDAEREEHQGLALLEAERRTQILADLRNLGAL